MQEKLPIGWNLIKLGAIYSFKGGGTPSKSKPEYWNGKIRWASIKDIKGQFLDDTKDRITQQGLDNSSANLAMKGDVILATRISPGKPIIVRTDTAINQDLKIAKPLIPICSNFTYFLFQNYQKKIFFLSSGTTVKGIKLSTLNSLEIPLPPLAEQKRIVAKLDTLMGHIERSKERLESIHDYKNKFINSCLVDTPTQSFFKRKKIGDYLEEGKGRIGENWQDCLKIGVSAKKGIIDLAVGQKKTFEKYKVVHPGDFIYNTMRVNIGSIAIYHGKEIAITSPDYVVFRVKKHLSKELLLGFLKSEQGQLEIGANTKGSVRSRLYFKSLSEVRMPISDLTTQQNAETFLASLNLSLKQIKTSAYPQLDRLKQSILAKAFRGELVEQDANDEPASVLLERIQAEQAALVVGKKKKRKN
jgi:type I restriction enzyme S subunit